ncbi:hemicentin-1-like [Crassostrea angulata]|uniref:hemicentin-1-like n=1 Tax=Magallana angulata TaxID=2784310 RepID=UPI0022B1D645|nr:hemicentin-1-like [Crassostrea angulata]
MQLFIALYTIHCGILCFVQGQILYISTLFMSGNVVFRWTPSSNSSNYYVFITRDRITDARTHVYDTQYTVKDAILYDSITINVRTPESLADNVVTYNVSKVKSQIGGRKNISWTAAYFPYLGYGIYHINKENRTALIMEVYHEGATLSPKYSYLTRPFNSTNIMFEIRNITLDDAGYYYGGIFFNGAGFGGGVILIVSGTPKKPRINGTLTTLVDTHLELTCISKSTSTPDYYSKLVTLSYTWFINNTKMDKETRDTLRLKVTKGHRYTRYSCTATEEDLESVQSDAVQINPLYGPEQLIFTPKPNVNKYDKFTVKEGDVVGPIFCSADCNPPCNVTWKYKESNGLKDALSQNGILLLQSINRNVTQIICSSRWKNESVEKDFTLDVQYFDDSIIYVNDEWVSDRITVDIQEKNPLQLSCLVNGNPIPTVRLGKTQNGGTVILSEARDHWSNYSFGTGAHCSDTGTYVCYGQSTHLKTSTKAIDVNILCKSFTLYGSSSSAKPDKPDIKGNLTTLVDTYLKLTCISKSTSTPDYYYKFRSLSYTWYINDTKIKREIEETIILNVTRWHRYNSYSCTATEEGLESDRSNAVQINPLYGPEKLTFTPKPTFDKGYKFTVKEGDEVGPIFCSADCNPPCNVSWKYKESNGLKDALSENGILLLQRVNRNVTQIICLSRWKTESMEKDIALDVQYIDDPIINVNGEWVSDRISVDIQERKPLHLSCFVNGNPTPSVRLGKSQNGRTTILSEAMDHWSNYNLSTGAKCSDTSTYVCYGKSQSTNLKTNKSIGVNILCEPRLDKEAQLKTLTDLGKARVLIIPVIAYPPPDLSKLVWLAPNNLPSNITANAVIQSNDIIYKHRVITIVSGLEDEHYGEYKLLYNRKFLTSVIIRKEEDAEDGPLRANIVDVAVPSALLGITWILLIIYVIFQKWRRNLKTTHQHDEKVNQLETQSLEQHYDDLQDIGEENNYSHLDRLDQETPYEETL